MKRTPPVPLLGLPELDPKANRPDRAGFAESGSTSSPPYANDVNDRAT